MQEVVSTETGMPPEGGLRAGEGKLAWPLEHKEGLPRGGKDGLENRPVGTVQGL